MKPYEELQKARHKTIGTRQTKKAVLDGSATKVYIAKDAEAHILKDLKVVCQEASIPCIIIDSMAHLGKACGIGVRAATAAILQD